MTRHLHGDSVLRGIPGAEFVHQVSTMHRYSALSRSPLRTYAENPINPGGGRQAILCRREPPGSWRWRSQRSRWRRVCCRTRRQDARGTPARKARPARPDARGHLRLRIRPADWLRLARRRAHGRACGVRCRTGSPPGYAPSPRRPAGAASGPRSGAVRRPRRPGSTHSH
jgi:hypothetical protein